MPVAAVLVKAKCLPSELQRRPLILAPGGVWTTISAPSGILSNLRALLKVALCSPLVFGLMRMPALRYMGSANSARGGFATGCPCSAKSRVGLKGRTGVGGAFRDRKSGGQGKKVD